MNGTYLIGNNPDYIVRLQFESHEHIYIYSKQISNKVILALDLWLKTASNNGNKILCSALKN